MSENTVQNDQLKKNETVGTCGTNGGKKRCLQHLDWEARGKETNRKTWIDLAQDRDK